jgi:23S rRNA (cytidine2498-2'-O)-methyltransferase
LIPLVYKQYPGLEAFLLSLLMRSDKTVRMTPIRSRFLFTTCQVGAEIALKEEVARLHPELHASYSRPGFVTFKQTQGEELTSGFELGSVFARTYGLSLKKAATAAEVIDLVTGLDSAPSPYCLHVWERDQWPPGEEPKGFVAGQVAEKVSKAIRDEARGRNLALFEESEQATPASRVIDVVCVEEDEWWLGVHDHSLDHSPFPGGAPKIVLPADAPSRAYLKLEEGVLWSGAPLKSGDTAVEIGSAPGGASYALLKRGLKVVGIDPADMDPQVLAFPGFTHMQRPVASVPREDLPETVHWLLLDMNVTPHVTLFQVDRLATRLSDSLLGVLLTVKLNEWKIAREIPHFFEHLRAMGMVRVRARQLASNKQEIFIYALTRKGVARIGMVAGAVKK